MNNYFLNLYNENEEMINSLESNNDNNNNADNNNNNNYNKEDMLNKVNQLKDFFLNAPNKWDIDNPIQRFMLSNGESISCILWNSLFFMTGTDIVRSLVYRFECYGRPVKNFKKFEEGIFSDLRNLKPGIDAILEEPRSEFLEMLYRSNCIRTQKKQKVFFWYSVPHDRLFIDALERDLKRESMGTEPTTEDIITNNNDDIENESENGKDQEDQEELDNNNNNNKRHPLAHSGIPKKVDKHLIYDNASLNPGNNNNILQQQRQLLEQSGLAFLPFHWELNPFTSPTNYLLPNNFDNPLLATSSFMNYSPQLFGNNLYHSPSFSDDMNNIDLMLSPNINNLNTTNNINPNTLSFDNSPLNQYLPFNESFLKSNGLLRNNFMKDMNPYPLPNKFNKMNNMVDPNERPHVCQVEYCGRAFKRSDQLRRHHKTHEHPFPCPHEKCPRTFNRKDQLAQHLALHHPEHLNSKGEIITSLNKPNIIKKENININNHQIHNSGSETEDSSFTPELNHLQDNDHHLFNQWNFNTGDNDSFIKNEMVQNLNFQFDPEITNTLDLMQSF